MSNGPHVEAALVRTAANQRNWVETRTWLSDEGALFADTQILANEVRRLAQYEDLDDRIRDLMDFFYDAPHTCDGEPGVSFRCVACLYLKLNDALLVPSEM